MWVLRPGLGPDRLGLLPTILQSADPAPLAEQLAARYIGGWSPVQGRHSFNSETGVLSYPGEPDLLPDAILIAPATNEMALLYPYDWLVILKPDDTWEISRVD